MIIKLIIISRFANFLCGLPPTPPPVINTSNNTTTTSSCQWLGRKVIQELSNSGKHFVCGHHLKVILIRRDFYFELKFGSPIIIIIWDLNTKPVVLSFNLVW